MGRKRRYTAQQVADALRESHGLIYAAARRLGCVPMTVLRYIERYPTLRDVVNAERGLVLDDAESALYAAVQRGEPWAVSLMLKTLGRSRGYVERHEMASPDGQPLRIVVEWQNVMGEGGADESNDG